MIMEARSNLAIEIKNLTKYYGRIRGVENISFTVQKGEIHGFLGPNGAGKTTTIRILVGILKPTSGLAYVFGHNAGSIEAKRLIGYLPSDFGLYEHYTVKEYLDFLETLRGEAPRKQELIELFQVELHKKTSALSRGNRQKVAIVQALMHEPALLIADEPTSGLDPLMQQEFESYLKEYIKRGGTAFISSHILTEIQEMAEKATVIRDGYIVASGEVEQMLATMPRKAVLKIKSGTNMSPSKIAAHLDARLGDVHGEHVHLFFTQDVKTFIGKIESLEGIEDFYLPEPSLEDYFMSFYARK